MLGHSRWLLLAAALIVMVVASGQTAEAARTWREYRSDNFIVYSDTSEKQARKLVEDLEFFRHYLQVFSSIKNTSGPMPLTIYAFKKRQDFYDEFDTRYAIGFYLDNPSGATTYVSLHRTSSDIGQSGRQVLFHEYVHYYMHQFSPYKYPKWYSEGFAEVLASFTRKGNRMTVGKPMGARMYALDNVKWMPLERLMELDGRWRDRIGERISGPLYGQSWITAHYFQNNAERNEQLQRFILALNLHVPWPDAFETAFEISPEVLGREVRGYRRRGKFDYLTLEAPKGDFAVDIMVRKLGEKESWLKLAEAHADIGFDESSREKVLKFTDKVLRVEPGNLQALSLRIEVRITAHDLDMAEEIINQLSTADRSDPRILLLEGRLHFARAIGADEDGADEDGEDDEDDEDGEDDEDSDDLEDEFLAPVVDHASLERAVTTLAKALAAAPNNPEAMYNYARAANLSESADPMRALKALIKARNFLPQNDEIERAYAEAAMRAGYPQQAAEIFQDYATWAYSKGTRHWAKKNLDAANALIEAEAE